jgi:hypothetical protein
MAFHSAKTFNYPVFDWIFHCHFQPYYNGIVLE